MSIYYDETNDNENEIVNEILKASGLNNDKFPMIKLENQVVHGYSELHESLRDSGYNLTVSEIKSIVSGKCSNHTHKKYPELLRSMELLSYKSDSKFSISIVEGFDMVAKSLLINTIDKTFMRVNIPSTVYRCNYDIIDKYS